MEKTVLKHLNVISVLADYPGILVLNKKINEVLSSYLVVGRLYTSHSLHSTRC